ncbi:winged helix-turn-helix transcriptional regulator [Mesosutterella sp. AGMB02718]|uniref:Winged helix-turn-helix transcriptional regulator n=1 Tax=Mesosutterella faecium TaxID=2925194 RepID=A0ABT7INV2_9BURK|nr:winged helix-turn-helix transcriptional regulator [Mesosutterella sp. AGMB02718]MDL2060059.1 winged helix-turn-helix transcriptional regulator [Mesosutterella sp. AGMB02718]
MKKIYHLAVDATLDVIRGKWKLRILCHLGNGTLRTGELRRLMPGISQKMLTQSLKELENAHIVSRRSYNEVPPRVEYSLTERGMSLRDILVEMSDWGSALVKARQEEGDDVRILNSDDEGFKNMGSQANK